MFLPLSFIFVAWIINFFLGYCLFVCLFVTTFCLSLYQLMDIWAVYSFWLLWLTLLWPFTYSDICYHFSWLDTQEWKYWVIWLSIWVGCWETAKLFSKVAGPFYILISNVWGLQFLPILPNFEFFNFIKIIMAILVSCVVEYHCGFICISLLGNDDKHLFICLLKY